MFAFSCLEILVFSWKKGFGNGEPSREPARTEWGINIRIINKNRREDVLPTHHPILRWPIPLPLSGTHDGGNGMQVFIRPHVTISSAVQLAFLDGVLATH